MKKLALVDFRISNEELNSLKNLNCEILKCPPSNNLYKAVCGHPDMLIHIISKTQLMIHPNTDKQFINLLQDKYKFTIIKSKKNLIDKYPYDIFLNGVNLKNYFIHNLKYTDENLLSYVKHKKLIDVKQGYTKCSVAIVNDNALITSDKSIYNKLKNEDMDVLLLPPGDINLPFLDYGFIGGTCGLLDKTTMVFYGSLDNYKYGDLVLNFLEKYNVKPIYLSNSKLVDRGSIFFLDII